MKSKRAFWYRAGTVILLLAIAGSMMIIGRGHTLYFDNKTLENGDVSYTAFHKVVVKVGDENVAKLSKRERGSTTCIGQHFTMTLEVTENKGDEPVSHTVSLTLPYGTDGIVINLPALLAGADESVYRSEFVATEPEGTDEEVVTDEFSLSDL